MPDGLRFTEDVVEGYENPTTTNPAETLNDELTQENSEEHEKKALNNPIDEISDHGRKADKSRKINKKVLS